MIWVAPSEKNIASATEKRLWDAADQFRANSGLKAQEYSGPILGLIFLRFAEVRFAAPARCQPGTSNPSLPRGSRVDEPAAPTMPRASSISRPGARFDYLLTLPEAEDIGAKVNAAMRDIEKHNPQLAGVLPKTYNLFTSTLLKELLKKVSEIPATLDYDAFGRIYEYFLGEFAMTEGRAGASSTPQQHRPAAGRRSSSPSTGASSTPPAARAACSCSRPASWPSTRRTPPTSWPSAASKRPTKPGACAA
jgi:type I restriction enzyme M protein